MKCRREPCFRHLLLWEREMKKCFWFHSLGRSDECLLTPRYGGVCANMSSQERSQSTGSQRDNLNAGPINLMSPFRKMYNNTWIYVSVKEGHSWFDWTDTDLDFFKILCELCVPQCIFLFGLVIILMIWLGKVGTCSCYNSLSFYSIWCVLDLFWL